MIRLALLLSLAFVALPAFAENKKPSLFEAKAEFEKADRELNEAWAAVKKALPESRFTELKETQRDWVKFRDERTEGGGDKQRAARSSASYADAARLTHDRVKWLLARAKNQDDPMTGLWFDGRGGVVQIVEQPGRLLFIFDVVRGASYDLGRLAGVATWNVNIGWFTDKGRDKEKTDETNIVFIRKGLSLEVIGANTNYYHGKRAYFDGIYSKASSLSDSDEIAVVKAGESGKVPEY